MAYDNLESSDLNSEENIIYNKNYSSNILGTHIPLPNKLIGKQLPFDYVYEPRKVGFPQDLRKSARAKEIKIILIWTKWNHLSKTINFYSLQEGRKQFINLNCPNSNCIVTNRRRNINKADSVVFHLLDTKIEDLPSERSPQQVWILYNMEPPWLITRHHPSDLYLFDHLFNRTMGYRSDSDVPAKYGFIMKSSPSQSQNYDGILRRKTNNVVWLVSNCVTDSRREDYVKELQKYIDVHVYGSCGNYSCYPSQSSSCYNTILKQYKFYLSFENAICKDYVTEKFFNVFNYDIIPIVFGAADYSKFAPKGSYIDALKYPQPQLMAKTLLKIANNESMYAEFLRKKSSFTAYLDPWVCRLCNTLHSSENISVLNNVEKWFVDDAQCKRWDSERKIYTRDLI